MGASLPRWVIDDYLSRWNVWRLDPVAYVMERLGTRPSWQQRQLLEAIAEEGANITAFHHDRTSRDVAMRDARVELELETRGPDHVERLLGALAAAGYDVEVLTYGGGDIL